MIRSRAIWTVVSMLAAAAGASAAAAHGTGASACAGLFDRRLEVCVAYVADATIAARVPYYALARSPNPARARLVRNRLESRYVARRASRSSARSRAGRAERSTSSRPASRSSP